tara:strand:- start:45 stop:284 length:240 start_codon:yes stop_codon:yes gene_type:complete
MAELENKYEDNAEGKYYVDEECIDCNLCREIAPSNFKANLDGGYSYVYKQPENQAEADECADALEQCPVEAIGNDGGNS